MDSIIYELRERRNEDLQPEAEAYRFAMNFAFSHPDTCEAFANRIWTLLAQITTFVLNVTRRYAITRRL
jgi:hypothetical protein